MTATRPDVHPDGLYNRKEAAAALGVNVSTLRRWVLARRIKPRAAKANMRLRYRGRDIINLWQSEYC